MLHLIAPAAEFQPGFGEDGQKEILVPFLQTQNWWACGML
jgi:hypothetical protein